MTPPRILVAGIGNMFMGDDAFGCTVAQQLMRHSFPARVTIRDFGIRGLDLAYELTSGYNAAILIDATPRGDAPPGTLYLLEPEIDGSPEAVALDAHSMDPMRVLQCASGMAALPRLVLILGCEPNTIGESEDVEIPAGMSPAVERAVGEAVHYIRTLLVQIVAGTISPNETYHLQEAP